jgi:hypothetical protein
LQKEAGAVSADAQQHTREDCRCLRNDTTWYSVQMYFVLHGKKVTSRKGYRTGLEHDSEKLHQTRP